jgi:ribosome-binding ATPase
LLYQEKWGASVIPVCAKIEAEMMDLSDEDRDLFLADYKTDDGSVLPTLHDLIGCAFSTL